MNSGGTRIKEQEKGRWYYLTADRQDWILNSCCYTSSDTLLSISVSCNTFRHKGSRRSLLTGSVSQNRWLNQRCVLSPLVFGLEDAYRVDIIRGYITVASARRGIGTIQPIIWNVLVHEGIGTSETRRWRRFVTGRTAMLLYIKFLF